MDEAIFSATYVDNYIDSVENLPDDVQRHLSRIRDIDVQYRNLLRDVDHYYDLWRSLQNCSETNSGRRARSVQRMQQSLIQAQELGDEKMQIVTQLQELIDHKTRQLDTDQKNLDIKEEKDEIMPMQIDECGAPTPQKQPRAQSPSRAGETTTVATGVGGGGVTNGNGGYGVTNSAALSTTAAAAGGGNSTPNSERSGSGNNLPGGNSSNGNSGNINLPGTLEIQRANSKRSRRRNDTVSNMDVCGNESNSANEGGSNGGERNLAQKTTNITSTQKKSAGQNQAGSSGGSVGGGASGGGSGSMAGSGSGSGNGGGATAAGASVATAAAGSGNNNSGKKKKRKARGAQSSAHANAREETPPPDPIDPDEPTYCVCNQISFGEMILCDNDLCPIEWFHFSCVSLVLKPKGKWYCPNCRGDRPNVMKPKAQFLKELERYNKEKEEKT